MSSDSVQFAVACFLINNFMNSSFVLFLSKSVSLNFLFRFKQIIFW